jgi:hypothetical protein
MDHREANESSHGGRIASEIAREAAIAADSGEGSFDEKETRRACWH